LVVSKNAILKVAIISCVKGIDMSEDRIEKEVEVVKEETAEQMLEIIDDEVAVEQVSIGSIQAQEVDLNLCATKTLNAAKADIAFSAALQSTSQDLDVSFGAMGAVKTGDALIKNSAAGVVLAEDGVNMEMAHAKAILTRGNVVMNKSVAVVTGARKAKIENSNIVFLVTGKLDGDVKPMFGPKETLIFGAVAGLVGGILVLTGKLFKGMSEEE
jgi:hypothetical protein